MTENSTKAAPEMLSIDLSTLTLGEIELFEELTGQPFDEAFQPGKPKAKAMRALAVISKRRTDPDFTWEQAGDLVMAVDSSPPDPTEPAG